VDSKDARVFILTVYGVKVLLRGGCRGCIKNAPIYEDAVHMWNIKVSAMFWKAVVMPISLTWQVGLESGR
jgi:hypothetical protein